MREVIVLAAVLAVGCTSQRDYDFLVAHAITTLAANADAQTIVLAPSLSEPARLAAAKQFKTIDRSAVIPVTGYDLAPGFFVLTSVTISGNTAHVKGKTGPVRSDATLGCGGTQDMLYTKSNGGWNPSVTESIVC